MIVLLVVMVARNCPIYTRFIWYKYMLRTRNKLIRFFIARGVLGLMGFLLGMNEYVLIMLVVQS